MVYRGNSGLLFKQTVSGKAQAEAVALEVHADRAEVAVHDVVGVERVEGAQELEDVQPHGRVEHDERRPFAAHEHVHSGAVHVFGADLGPNRREYEE